MTDDRYNAGHRIAPRQRQPGEPLWTIHVDHVTWSCELRSHGEYGQEAQIYRDGDFVIGHRFHSRDLAIRWAELQRREMGRGR
jgi:hypothetical protein